ncbi:Hypp5417 [Branchiostoma lanceolatum]|uniref:chitinase n=1 Tax=Branchiostoma lanceolatum TaxID=7740 RepID=A0A8K0EZ02_BRALA|nr:Hypp5417 [Branchiostoma lanceolatum]
MYSTVVFCLLAMSGALAMPVTDQMNSTQSVTEMIQNATQAQDVTVEPIVVNVTEQVGTLQPTSTTQSTPLVTDNVATNASTPTGEVVVETTTEPPKFIFTCDGKTAGLYADTDNCYQYYECVDGFSTAFVRMCAPGGPVFDPAKQRCDWPENVPAPCGTKVQVDGNIRARSSPLARSFSTFSCTGKQPGLYADPADCSMYYECVLGHPVYHRPCAPGGTVYDPASLRCMWPHEVSGPCGINANLVTDETSANLVAHDVPAPSTFSCTGKQPGLYADPADCSMYYECVLGHPVYHRPCAPGGTVYDPASLRCMWPHEVSGPCGTSANLVTDETSANLVAHDVPVPSTFSCTGKQPGLYADPADCSMYYECVLGHPVYHRPCAPGGTVYDPARQECRWPYEVSGPCRAYTLPASRTEPFSCAGKAPGHYPDPASCSRYYQCTQLSSTPFHRDCPPGGLVFDAGRQYCTWPWSVAGPCGNYGQ